MTTVQDLLERLGKPPLEVCLDWAWQLDRLAQSQATQTTHPANLASQPADSAVPAASRKVAEVVEVAGDVWAVGDDTSGVCDWSQLTVDDHGQLHWLASAAASPAPPDSDHSTKLAQLQCGSTLRVGSPRPDSDYSARLVQLLQWCAADDAPQTETAVVLPPATHQPQTRQLQTHQLHTHLQQRTLQWASAQASAETPTETPSVAQTSNATPATQRLTGSTRTTPIRHKPRKRQRFRNLAATLAVAGLLLAVVTALTQRAPSTTATGSASLPQAAPASIFEATERHTEQHTARHAEQPLALSTDSVLAADPLASSRGGSADASSLLQDAANGTANSSSQRESTEATQELPSQPAAELTHEPLHSDDATQTQIAAEAMRPTDSDVLAELAALSKSAEATTSEVKIPSPEPTSEAPAPADSASTDSEHSEPAPDPLLLQAFPMIQLQEFDKRLRVRQPQWRLRLAASQGLEVLPSDAQELGDEQWIGWAIRSAEPSQPLDKRPHFPFTPVDSGTARVAVQVRLSKKRESSLHWRIVATSDDYPQIALPLDQAWLDRFQEYLSNYIAGLRQESQRMRELGRAAGLPSQTRSALSTRRRGLDSEGKLAAGLLEIVADANQMVGWLDGQIEVHGELVDASANPPTVLLQFGSP